MPSGEEQWEAESQTVLEEFPTMQEVLWVNCIHRITEASGGRAGTPARDHPPAGRFLHSGREPGLVPVRDHQQE